jgi:hypothetical protein
MTKAVKIEKGAIVEVPKKYQKSEGCVAFQIIAMTYMFYGAEMKDTFDTKILNDGSQYVISGNGFIKDGFKIN